MEALIGSLTIFVAVTSFMLWLVSFRASPVEGRLKNLQQRRTPASLDGPFYERVISPMVDGTIRLSTQLLPHTFVVRVASQLVTAGSPMTTQAFFLTVFLSGVLSSGVPFLLMLAAGLPAVAIILVMMLFGFVGMALPFLWLRRSVRHRKLSIWKSLPDAFDLITLCVEAGLGLDAALRQVAAKFAGALADEINRTLREVGMGRLRREALQEMAERAAVPELISFVNAVIQAEQLGTSLGRVLRAQASTLRTRRRQRAEEMARKVPAKMVVPLVLCIMPSLFIVVLGPIIIHLVSYLSG